MKKCLTFVLFVFILLPCSSQVNQADARQLFNQLARSNEDTSRIRIYIQLAESYFNRLRLPSRMDSVEFYLKKADQLNKIFNVTTFQNRIKFLYAWRHGILFRSQDPRNTFLPVIEDCKKTGDKSTHAQALLQLGNRIEMDSASVPFKLSCFQNAQALALELGDKYTEVRSLIMIADVHVQQKKFELAEGILFKLLKEEKQSGPTILMYTYDELSLLYIYNGEFDKALKYALLTQKMLGDSGDSTAAFESFNRISKIYLYMGKSTESLEWAKIDLDYQVANLITGTYEYVVQIINLYRQQNRSREGLSFLLNELAKQKPKEINDQRIVQSISGELYRELKMYDLAEKSYTEMIRLGNQQTRGYEIWDKGYDNTNMGSFFYQRGKYEKARFFLEKGLAYYEQYGGLPYIRISHLWLFKTDSALGDFTGAIRHLKEGNRLSDSIFNMNRNKQIEELQITYQTEQKDKDFRILAGKEKVTQLQLQQSKSTRNWIIAGAALLLIIATLLSRLALLRKKNNTIINNKNEQLKHLVTEKEWLLKEVHHRVKNNLHTVIGLLESQAAYLEDDALKANEVSKHRIYTMSLIHQQLYKADDIKTIDMSVYLPELIDYLKESFDTGTKIRFRHDIEPLKLGVSQAIPIGLIVNEAVTNAIKYAFTPGRDGLINISMHELDGKINLIIADDGIGIDPSLINAATTSMGLKLMKGLTEDIEGDIQFTHQKGTRIAVSFHTDALLELSTT